MRNEITPVSSQSLQQVWTDPRTGVSYFVARTGGQVTLTPVEAYNHPQPIEKDDRSLDPIALLGIGAAGALLIAIGAWWIGYVSAPKTVNPPSQVVICETTRRTGFFSTEESTRCK